MLARIGEMNIGQLRAFWRERFASDPPAAFSKDLLARAFCHRLQEQTFGGLSASTDRMLRSLIKPGAEPPRQLKVGSVLIREHQGVVHEVLVVPGGFRWQGKTYDSLSSVAKTITGTIWNGPRFFGLRSRKIPIRRRTRPPVGLFLTASPSRLRLGRTAVAPVVDPACGQQQPATGRRLVKTVAPKRQRCAIYTRKSTEHNLDLAFNSLDAQREACEAYIKSQAHEGWVWFRDRFDDGGLSGASLDRPALQDLLNEVRASQLDIIVVYKVDRLTRSLADFAKFVELSTNMTSPSSR